MYKKLGKATLYNRNFRFDGLERGSYMRGQ